MSARFLGNCLVTLVFGSGLTVPAAFGQSISSASAIVVVAGKAPVMSGAEQIATVAIGQEFAVQQTNGAWHLIAVPTPQGTKPGWLNREHTRKLFLPPQRPLRPTGRADGAAAQKAITLSATLADQEKWREAADQMEFAVTSAYQILGSEHDYVNGLEIILAACYQKLHLHAQAERFYARAFQYLNTHPVQDPEGVALSLVNISDFYRDRGQYAKAEPPIQRAIQLLETKHGADHIEVAKWLMHQASLYSDWGRFSQAEPLFLRCLRIYEAQHGKDHLEVAGRLSNLGTLYDNMERTTEAESYFLRALAIQETQLGPNHADVADTLTALGVTHLRAGQLPQAKQELERAVRVLESRLGAKHLNVAGPLARLANVSEAQADFTRAEALYQQALAIQEAHLGPDHLTVATTLRTVGRLYQVMRLFDKAAACYERSLKIREPQVDQDDLELRNTVLGLGMIYKDLGQLDKAEPYYLRALAFEEKRSEADRSPFGYATVLNNLAGFYKVKQDYGKARPMYQRALTMLEAAVGPDHPDTGICVANLAHVYQLEKDLDRAEPLYRRAVQIAETRLSPQHPEVAASLFDLTRIYVATGRWPQAFAAKDRENRVLRHHIARVLPGLSDREQFEFVEIHQTSFSSGQTMALKPSGIAQAAERSAEWLVNGKAIIQRSLAQRVLLARDTQDPALAKVASQLRDVRQSLAALTLASVKPEEAQRRKEQIVRLTGQEQELAKQVGQLGSQAGQTDGWVQLADVRRQLPADAVFIDVLKMNYFDFAELGTSQRTNEIYAVWIVPPAGRGDVQVLELGPAGPIEAAVDDVRRAMGSAAKDILDLGEAEAEAELKRPLAALSKLVLAAMEPAIGDYARWIVSADASLWLVPWSAMVLGDGSYVIQQHGVEYRISGRELVQPPAPAAHGPAFVLANPDFNREPASLAASEKPLPLNQLASRGDLKRAGDALSIQWAALPGTAQEAKTIAPQIGKLHKSEPTLLTGRDAAEGRFKALVRPRMVVLSTHGFFEESGGDSTAELRNPLLRCGLVLAGANRRNERTDLTIDDGILTGLEIVSTDLRGTELVVLSACETGVGKVTNGEGVAGLRQAFQLAGAQVVVATLWQIPDRESAQLMTGFFASLADGQTKADALRNAQLSLIKDRREQHGAAHPFFWAAFTITGQ